MKTVLIIDDESAVCESLSINIREMGYDAIATAKGDSAEELIQQHGVDLVITDIYMPEQDGLEIIRRLRKQWAKMPIIAISGGGESGNLDVLRTALALGASASLIKPYEPAELESILQQFLNGRS